MSKGVTRHLSLCCIEQVQMIVLLATFREISEKTKQLVQHLCTQNVKSKVSSRKTQNLIKSCDLKAKEISNVINRISVSENTVTLLFIVSN